MTSDRQRFTTSYLIVTRGHDAGDIIVTLGANFKRSGVR